MFVKIFFVILITVFSVQVIQGFVISLPGETPAPDTAGTTENPPEGSTEELPEAGEIRRIRRPWIDIKCDGYQNRMLCDASTFLDLANKLFGDAIRIAEPFVRTTHALLPPKKATLTDGVVNWNRRGITH